jgi:hypothetical protein
MTRTFHGSRDERRTERATMARRIATANRIADTLDELAARREARHQAEIERAEARRCAETDDGLVWVGDWE